MLRSLVRPALRAASLPATRSACVAVRPQPWLMPRALCTKPAAEAAPAAAEAEVVAEVEAEPEEPAAPPPPAEELVGESTKMEFQAETKRLLDIVAKSLYTDKEIFLRELISNASDALEKRRYQALAEGGGDSGSSEGAIEITTDKDAGTVTIQDNGIGMSKEELVENLGTIARSGSRKFMAEMAEKGGAAEANVIGQFGVGFYSVFMVADEVTVYSRKAGTDEAFCWRSQGDGAYELTAASNVGEGTKIIMKLKDGETSFTERYTVERNIRKYSNYIGFPIKVDGERVNTVEALWTKSKNEVTQEQHNDFFKYLGQEFTDPRFTLHFAADAPVSIKAIFYVPNSHMEKYGMARQDPGVSLYSRKVLIESKTDKLLPDWMRFLKGVVDSEDLPLNISRESMQDSALMRKLNTVLKKRVVKFLADEAKKDESKYLDFWREFQQFIKEGVCSDWEQKADIAKLLRFESTASDSGDLVSLDSYISRMVPEQEDKIFYLLSSHRENALASAYYEVCKAKGVEVLLLYSTIDVFAAEHLQEYAGKKLVSAEVAEFKVDQKEETMSDAEVEALGKWMSEAVPGIREVTLSSRLIGSPAMIVGHESAAMRKMMGYMEAGKVPELAPQQLEINGSHPTIRGLAVAREAQPELAKLVAQQLYDNALVSAGLMEDPREMLGNLNAILGEAIKAHVPEATEAPTETVEETKASASSE